jgi:hypothetical protein
VIIRRIVTIKTVFYHLVDKPAVDAFVKMRWFYVEKKRPQHGGEAENQPEHPVAVECV